MYRAVSSRPTTAKYSKFLQANFKFAVFPYNTAVIAFWQIRVNSAAVISTSATHTLFYTQASLTDDFKYRNSPFASLKAVKTVAGDTLNCLR